MVTYECAAFVLAQLPENTKRARAALEQVRQARPGTATVPDHMREPDPAEGYIGPDPIHAAIEAHRIALALRMSALNAEGLAGRSKRDQARAECDRTCSAEGDHWTALLRTTPTTIAGLAALAEHLRSVASELDEVTEDTAPFMQAFLALHASAVALGAPQV